MNQCGSDGNSRWPCCVSVARWSLAATVLQINQVVEGSCGRSSTRRRQNYQEGKCWYELWYFWFIVGLVFLTVAVLVVFFCKQQAKRSTGRQGRRCTPVLNMPMAPPQYDTPGHQPPPYHIAISSPTLPDCPTLGAQGIALYPHVSSGAPPPGYVSVTRCSQDTEECDTLSLTSVTSVGAISNPPPYSPPRSAYHHATQQLQLQQHTGRLTWITG